MLTQKRKRTKAYSKNIIWTDFLRKNKDKWNEHIYMHQEIQDKGGVAMMEQIGMPVH